MNKKIFLIITLLVSQFMMMNVKAQCTMDNHAFSNNEVLTYKLYFNWKFIWVTAGTASLTTKATTYKGQPAYSSYLITKSSKKVDKFFMMRDTLVTYCTNKLAPLYYRKGAREGKRYYVDEMWYNYAGGNCNVSLKHLNSEGKTTTEKHSYTDCVYDMLSIFLRARNFNPKGWKKGYVIPVNIAGGEQLQKAKLIYHGTETVKAEDGKKYECLVLAYVEKDGKKDKEIVRFFVTNDSKHVPIRLDLNLRFGSAKAFLSSMKL